MVISHHVFPRNIISNYLNFYRSLVYWLKWVIKTARVFRDMIKVITYILYPYIVFWSTFHSNERDTNEEGS
jgi:hypothetical protein